MTEQIDYPTRNSLITPVNTQQYIHTLNGNLAQIDIADNLAKIFESKALFISNPDQAGNSKTVLVKWMDLLDIYLQLFIPVFSITRDLNIFIRKLESVLNIPNRTLQYETSAEMINDIEKVCNITNHKCYVILDRNDVSDFIQGYSAIKSYQDQSHSSYIETNLMLKPVSVSDKIEVLDDSFLELVNKKCGDIINVDSLVQNSMIYSVASSGILHPKSYGIYRAKIDFNAYLCNENIERESYLRILAKEWSSAAESCLSMNTLCIPIKYLTSSLINRNTLDSAIDIDKSILDQKYDALVKLKTNDEKSLAFAKKLALSNHLSSLQKWNSDTIHQKFVEFTKSKTVSNTADEIVLNMPIIFLAGGISRLIDYGSLECKYADNDYNILEISGIADSLISVWKSITKPLSNFNFSASAVTFAQEAILPYIKKRFNIDDTIIESFDDILINGPSAFKDPKVRDSLSKVLTTSVIPTIIRGFSDKLGKGDINKSQLSRIYKNIKDEEIKRMSNIATVYVADRKIKLNKLIH